MSIRSRPWQDSAQQVPNAAFPMRSFYARACCSLAPPRTHARTHARTRARARARAHTHTPAPNSSTECLGRRRLGFWERRVGLRWNYLNERYSFYYDFMYICVYTCHHSHPHRTKPKYGGSACPTTSESRSKLNTGNAWNADAHLLHAYAERHENSAWLSWLLP